MKRVKTFAAWAVGAPVAIALGSGLYLLCAVAIALGATALFGAPRETALVIGKIGSACVFAGLAGLILSEDDA